MLRLRDLHVHALEHFNLISFKVAQITPSESLQTAPDTSMHELLPVPATFRSTASSHAVLELSIMHWIYMGKFGSEGASVIRLSAYSQLRL